MNSAQPWMAVVISRGAHQRAQHVARVLGQQQRVAELPPFLGGLRWLRAARKDRTTTAATFSSAQQLQLPLELADTLAG